MKNRVKKSISLLLAVIMLICAVPMTDISIRAGAITFSQLNDPSVFLKQAGSKTCTLCATTMMLRRYSMLRGDSNWNTITESSVRSPGWIDGTGLRWSFSYSNSYVSSISVGHGTLPGGSSNASTLIEMLKKCPEGIVIYNTSVPHAVLLTDYTDGVFYCADPSSSYVSGRIPLTSSYKVRIDNVTAYWKVTSPVVPGPTSEPFNYADLGNDFYAYIGHPDLSKFVAAVNNNVQCEDATAYDNQTWRFIRHGDGSYSVLSYDTGYAMDVSNYSTEPGTNLQMMPYVDNGAQRFYIYVKDGYFFLRCSYSDIWFDVNYDNLNVKLEKGTGYPAQRFIIQKCDVNGELPQNLGDDFYAYISHPDSSKWVAAINNNVECENENTGANQTWRFIRHGDGSYSVLSYDTGYAMDVSNYSTEPGTNLQTMPYVDNGAQRFYIYEKDGYYYFRCSYVDMWFNVNYDSNNIDLEKQFWSKSQKFKIIDNAVYSINYFIDNNSAPILQQTKFKSRDISLSSFVPEANEKIFVCWNTKVDGSGTRYLPDEKYANDSDLNLYPVWIDSHTHSYDSGKTTTAATCKSTGVKTYTCTVCKATKTETLPKNPSNHVGGTAVKNALAATCTAKGYTGDTYCLGCGVTTLKGKEIAATGHTDTDNDGKCDICGTAVGTPAEPEKPDTPSAACNHICHKSGIAHFFYLIARLFWKMFKTNKYCSCGAAHY